MKHLMIDIRPADACWRERYGEDAMSVRIGEDTHFGSVIVSEENARILRAAHPMYAALTAEYDMLTPAAEADELARHALELAEGKPRPAPRRFTSAQPAPSEEKPNPEFYIDDALKTIKYNDSVANIRLYATVALESALKDLAALRSRLSEQKGDGTEESPFVKQYVGKAFERKTHDGHTYSLGICERDDNYELTVIPARSGPVRHYAIQPNGVIIDLAKLEE